MASTDHHTIANQVKRVSRYGFTNWKKKVWQVRDEIPFLQFLERAKGWLYHTGVAIFAMKMEENIAMLILLLTGNDQKPS